MQQFNSFGFRVSNLKLHCVKAISCTLFCVLLHFHTHGNTWLYAQVLYRVSHNQSLILKNY